MKISYTMGLQALGIAFVTGLLGVGCSSDKTDNTGGNATTGGTVSATGGKPSNGGATSTTTGGTAASVGGTSATATGGAVAVGGTTGIGGTSAITTDATGGVAAVGGTSSTSACGTDTSTYSETATFTDSSAAPSWALNSGSSQAGATFSFTTTSPAGSTICDAGCGVLSFTIPAGTGWGGSTIVDRWFASPQNLLGNTVKAQVALEVDPAAASAAVVQVFTQGGSTTSYAWGANASSTAAVTDTTTWHEISLSVANTGSYCASDTGAVGLIVQRKADSTTDIPGKLYIKSVVIGGSASTGTGGASSTGGSSSTSTTSTAGGNTTAGGATSTTTTAGGNTSTGGTTSSSTSIACPGCLDLYTPLAAASTGTDFEVDFGASTVKDFSATTITAHVYVVTAGNAGGLRLYVKNDTTYASVYTTWEDLTAKTGWQDITLNVSADTSTFDKTKVRWLGINVSAGSTWSGAVFGNTTVYVDSITFSDSAATNFTFDSTIQGWAINTYNSPVTGSTITWVNQ